MDKETIHHALGGSQEKPKKEIHEMRVRKGKSGGYIHEHHHTHPEHHPMEEHTTADQDAMASHMLENMGTPNPGEAEADPNGAAASPDAPAAAMAAGGGSGAALATPGA